MKGLKSKKGRSSRTGPSRCWLAFLPVFASPLNFLVEFYFFGLTPCLSWRCKRVFIRREARLLIAWRLKQKSVGIDFLPVLEQSPLRSYSDGSYVRPINFLAS
ncbi:hypothetical protein SAY87_029586 [Trapa incisa]|uniref:Uncharacterized protein n=1 Tax=Trapa incisa TaxID=236973 RepID=A0AAN7Q939_9MYRT|nr:hypothetical protein SAY87_029586 [Trapa incisa]